MKKVLTRMNDGTRQAMLPLLLVAALSISTTAAAGEVLFVSDSVTDAENIPDVLSGGTAEVPHPSIAGAGLRPASNDNFHDVTIIRNDYDVTGGTFGMAEGTNPTLAGDLSGYCSVFWSASGPHEPLGLSPVRLNNGALEDVNGTFVDNTGLNYMVLSPGDTELPGWTIGQTVVWGIDPSDGFNASEGEGFVDLSSLGNQSSGAISQVIPTKTGVTYEFSIDRQGDGSIVSFNGTDAALTAGATTGSWTTYTAVFTATSVTTTLAIRKDPNDTSGIVFIDNMSFVPQPAPDPGLGADGGLHTDAGVFTNLEDYVQAGGFVFVTGHDAIAHPLDPLLVEFVGGVGASAGQQFNPIYNSVSGVPATAVTTGSEPIVGFTPQNGGINQVDNMREQDYLAMITDPNVTVLVSDFNVGIGADAAAWIVRHPNGTPDDFDEGHIAYVANGVFFYETEQEDDTMALVAETLSNGEDPSWLVPAGAYRSALLNFAENACTEPELPTLDDVNGRGKGTKINLTWTANGADSYDVFRSDTPGGPYDPIGSTATNVYVDSPVVPGNTYYYVVQGVFGGENSADSNEAEVVVSARRRR